MKELKFRIFNKKTKQIFKVTSINFDNCIIEVIDKTNKDWRISFPLDECEIMQYTGLKDKNKNEIYEGDILIYELTLNVVECYWNENGFWESWDYLPLLKIIGNIHENPDLI